MLKKIIVIKLGGSTFNSQGTILEDLVSLQREGIAIVVVHGGAQRVSEWLGRLGIATQFINGLRVTDAETLKVVVAVLAGLVNKELVLTLEAAGGKAIGLSGVDGSILEAKMRNDELGYTGEVIKVNPKPIETILEAGYIPVIAPLSLQAGGGGLLNINGDHAAGEIAAAIEAEKLLFLTDVEGVYDSSGNLLQRLSFREVKELLGNVVASGGMIPKLEACLRALPKINVARIIDGRVPHILLKEKDGGEKGTTIVKE
jgi:acetylglutamate kinase